MVGKKAFFVGIKGVGMTSLACAMQDEGWEISGSDSDESFITDDILASRHITILTPANVSVPQDSSLVVYSAAYDKPDGAENALTLAEALAEFVRGRNLIAVAGVGGKTTTTAMLAALFQSRGRDVGYYVGTSSISGLASPGHAGKDPWFLVEADEYAVSKVDKRPKFVLLAPEIVVTTNIIHDHPDIYPLEDDTLSAFSGLISKLPPGGSWIYNLADPLTRIILDKLERQLREKKINLVNYGGNLDRLNLKVFGRQNQLDAQAAVTAAVASGMNLADAKLGIGSYGGAGRRQEFHGEVKGRLLYDDYGHHPEEITVTIESFKEHFPGRRILLVFESHTYSRTESLLPAFAKAIALADLPFLMPIFESAREQGKPHAITPEIFTAEVSKFNSHVSAVTWDNAADVVWGASREGDLILTMGAGFVYKLHHKFKNL